MSENDKVTGMSGRNFLLTLIFFLVGVLIGGLTVSVYIVRPQQDKYAALEKELQNEKEKNRVYIIRDDRRRCISKTLQLAYNLSEWESFCYATLFDEFSLLYKTHWALYGALIRVETNFNPTLKSGKDCKGLMQIKESTGADVAKKLNIQYKENVSLWNEFINFAIGATYLSDFIAERGVHGSIKSYLGGPDYKKSIQKKIETFKYVKEYKTRVSEECDQLQYMYRGIVDEYSITDYEEIDLSINKDTTALIFEIFEVEIPDSIKE